MLNVEVEYNDLVFTSILNIQRFNIQYFRGPDQGSFFHR